VSDALAGASLTLWPVPGWYGRVSKLSLSGFGPIWAVRTATGQSHCCRRRRRFWAILRALAYYISDALAGAGLIWAKPLTHRPFLGLAHLGPPFPGFHDLGHRVEVPHVEQHVGTVVTVLCDLGEREPLEL
jgi:hypothetical protein